MCLVTGSETCNRIARSKKTGGPGCTLKRQTVWRQNERSSTRMSSPMHKAPIPRRGPPAALRGRMLGCKSVPFGVCGRPHTCTCHAQGKKCSGPRLHTQRTDGRAKKSAQMRTPLTEARFPYPGTLQPSPQRATAARKSVCCGVRDRSPYPHLPRPKKQGSAPWVHARKMGGQVRESA